MPNREGPRRHGDNGDSFSERRQDPPTGLSQDNTSDEQLLRRLLAERRPRRDGHDGEARRPEAGDGQGQNRRTEELDVLRMQHRTRASERSSGDESSSDESSHEHGPDTQARDRPTEAPNNPYYPFLPFANSGMGRQIPPRETDAFLQTGAGSDFLSGSADDTHPLVYTPGDGSFSSGHPSQPDHSAGLPINLIQQVLQRGEANIQLILAMDDAIQRSSLQNSQEEFDVVQQLYRTRQHENRPASNTDSMHMPMLITDTRMTNQIRELEQLLRQQQQLNEARTRSNELRNDPQQLDRLQRLQNETDSQVQQLQSEISSQMQQLEKLESTK